MECNGEGAVEGKWRFSPKRDVLAASDITIRTVKTMVESNLPPSSPRGTIPLGHGDPSIFQCFRTAPEAVEAVVAALLSGEFNCYSPTAGVVATRGAVAKHLSKDLPYALSVDDVYLTAGCTHAIETVFSVLAQPQANILLPRPGYPFYEARATFSCLEFRHYDLLPEKGWEVDLEALEALADDHTVAMLIVNPGNPCGNVFSHHHLSQIASTARKLGIMVIADEVYAHLSFGRNKFVPMGVFGSTVPVLTLGSISKRWAVPGWRLGWIASTDPDRILQKTKIIEGIKAYLSISSDPVTFMQVAVPQIIENTKAEFFEKSVELLKQTSEICFDRLNEISCISCLRKPEGSMFTMVKLDLSLLEDVKDDVDFCCKLAKEESVVILPGSAVGYKSWLRVTFAVAPDCLEDGLQRLKSFCERHCIRK